MIKTIFLLLLVCILFFSEKWKVEGSLLTFLEEDIPFLSKDTDIYSYYCCGKIVLSEQLTSYVLLKVAMEMEYSECSLSLYLLNVDKRNVLSCIQIGDYFC